jgi:N-formylglutamate amidohydrolase
LYRRTLDLARHPSYKSQHERKYFSEFDPLAVRPDSSTGSELKAVEEACREASRTVESIERLERLEQVFRPWKALLTHDRSTLQRKSSLFLFLPRLNINQLDTRALIA